MFGLELGPGFLALIGTIIATIGVEIIKRWLTSKDRSVSDAAGIRSELREQVNSYKEEIRRLEDEVDEWRGKYYITTEELVAKRLELINALDQIKHLTDEVQKRAADAAKIVNKNVPPMS